MPRSCYMHSPVTHPPRAFRTAWLANAQETRHTLCHATQPSAPSGRTCSQLSIYSMNIKISSNSDFTSRLINRLSLTPWLAQACTYLRDEHGTLPCVHCSVLMRALMEAAPTTRCQRTNKFFLSMRCAFFQ